MRPGGDEDEQFGCQIVDEQPVRLDVTFPKAGELADQPMRAAAFGELFIANEQIDDPGYFVEGIALFLSRFKSRLNWLV